MTEQPDHDNASHEHYESFAPSVLGFGALRGEGKGTAVPEHEVLATAIPMWVTVDEHADDALDLCLEFATHLHAAVRLAAVTAIGDLARRHGRLEQQERVSRTLRQALGEADADVRQAAARSCRILREDLGWDLPAVV